MECKILEQRKCKITNEYSNKHQAIDIVGENPLLDYVIAHSAGKVVFYQDGLGNTKGSTGNLSYGNCIKIEHKDGYSTLYAHMKNDLYVKLNQEVKEGQIIGYISDSGNAYGKHLHFEVWKNNKRINPKEYLNKSFKYNEDNELKYSVGDIVEINGVYVSSTSKEKLRPLITRGKITKIIENTKNPYLLDEGKIGWVNDDTIISKINNRYLSNKNYKGNSIVEALNEIKINSSYKYREEIAKINNFNNYQGTAAQNTEMLNLLKQGILKY